MLTLQDKQKATDSISDTIKKAHIVGIFGIRGLPNRQLETLRRKVKKNGGYFKVAKRSLIWRAAANNKIPITADPKEPVAFVADFDEEMNALKTLPKKDFSFLFGIFGGKIITREEVEFFQSLPDKRTLRATAVMKMKALFSKFVYVLKVPQQRLQMSLNAAVKR